MTITLGTGLLMAVLLGGPVAPPTTQPTPTAPARWQYDPIEDDPQARPLIEAANREAEAAVNLNERRERGLIHQFWAVKKRILREKYGINWRTPAEMNPGVAYD